MACGSVLVTTDFAGARDYTVNNVNAIVSKAKIDVFKNEGLAMKLMIYEAKNTIVNRTWDEAVTKFIEVLNIKNLP